MPNILLVPVQMLMKLTQNPAKEISTCVAKRTPTNLRKLNWTTPPFDEEERLCECFVEPTLRQFSVARTLLVLANTRATTRRYRKVRHAQITLCHAIVRHICYPSKISLSIVVKLAFSLRRHFFNGGFAISYQSWYMIELRHSPV